MTAEPSTPGSAPAPEPTTTYLARLARRSAQTGTVLCVGLDPDPASLPDGFGQDLAGIERFARLVLEAALPFAAAVKPNLAFFEAFGSAGIAALERLRGGIPSDVPVIMDAKRGDIGTTAARQAVALFDALGADAVTVNPYLGGMAVAPLFERLDRFAYVLCRTSNTGAAELQSLVVAADEDAPPGAPLRPGRPERAALGPRWNRGAGRRGDCAVGAARDPGDRSRARVSRAGRRRAGRRDRPGPSGWPGHGWSGRRPGRAEDSS